VIGGIEVRNVLIAIGVALALGSCSEDPEPGGASSASTAAPTVSPSTPTPSAFEERWIAVVRVAPEPSDLDALTQQLLDPLGTALVVSPAECFEGLPDTALGGYLIGAVGDTRSEAEGLVLDAGEEVVFSAHVTIVCTD
jgi:hypothetical protein